MPSEPAGKLWRWPNSGQRSTRRTKSTRGTASPTTAAITTGEKSKAGWFVDHPTRHHRANREQHPVPIGSKSMSELETKKFSLGRIVSTPGAIHALLEAGQ